MGTRIVQHFQPLLGLATQLGAGEPFRFLRQPIAQAQAGAGTDPREVPLRTTGKLAHEGTSSCLANDQITTPEDTSPLPPVRL